MRAECPDWNIQDIRAMKIEEEDCDANETPESLFQKINQLIPTVDEFVLLLVV